MKYIFRVPITRLKKQKEGTETLERIKRWPSLKMNLRQDAVHIYNGEWGAFWGPNGNGYTDNISKAGVYTLEEALSCSGHCGPEKKIYYLSVAHDFQI